MIIKRRLGKNGRITIPKYIRNFLGLKSGQYIVFEVMNKEVRIGAN